MNFETIVIGFTGAFGSGCTTAAKHLRDERGFRFLALSTSLRSLWSKEHPNSEPQRFDLQKLGDQLREKDGLGVLVDASLRESKDDDRRLVVDGIRNLGEINRMRDIFGYWFTLFSILSSRDARWSRISSKYTDSKLTRDDFNDDDERDRDEDTIFGQQVELCLDKADILLNNRIRCPWATSRRKLRLRRSCTRRQRRSASQPEILMSMAFSSSHSSKCLKRHVGALVVDTRGQVVGVGYNENPLGTNPCVEEPTYEHRCYRDILRNAHFEDLAKRGARCPKCGEPLQHKSGPPWRCETCQKRGRKRILSLSSFRIVQCPGAPRSMQR